MRINMKKKDVNSNLHKPKDGSVSTKGNKKLRNRFQDLIREERFLEDVQSLRKNYRIPIAGYVWTSTCELPPKQWMNSRSHDLQRLEGEVKKLATIYELHPMDWLETLLFFVFYNHVEMWEAPHSKNLCLVCDVVMDSVNPMPYEIQDMDNKAYPVAIRLSAYASERDILDFVRRVYSSEVEPIQRLYRRNNSVLTKSRERDAERRERDDF